MDKPKVNFIKKLDRSKVLYEKAESDVLFVSA